MANRKTWNDDSWKVNETVETLGKLSQLKRRKKWRNQLENHRDLDNDRMNEHKFMRKNSQWKSRKILRRKS